MNRTIVRNTNESLLNVLGLCHLHHVTAMTLEVKAGHLPVVTVIQALPHNNWALRASQFKLVTMDEEPLPLDIEAMCDAARARLAEFIEAKADAARTAIRSQYIGGLIADAVCRPFEMAVRRYGQLWDAGNDLPPKL